MAHAVAAATFEAFALSEGMMRRGGRCEIVHVLPGSSLRGGDGEDLPLERVCNTSIPLLVPSSS